MVRDSCPPSDVTISKRESLGGRWTIVHSCSVVWPPASVVYLYVTLPVKSPAASDASRSRSCSPSSPPSPPSPPLVGVSSADGDSAAAGGFPSPSLFLLLLQAATSASINVSTATSISPRIAHRLRLNTKPPCLTCPIC